MATATMIEYVESQHLVEYAATMGAYFKAGLEELQSEFELIGNVSGLGMNLAVDLVLDRKSKARASHQAQALMNFCMSRGISFKLIQGNILNLKPSLVVTQGELDYVLDTLRAGLV
jgi:4-aminobutyrate aminotransferase